MFLYDYRCGTPDSSSPGCHAVTESIETKGTERIPCPSCGGSARRIISGTHQKTKYGYAATMGGREPPPDPRMMDTRSLAEGGRYRDWKKKRQAQRNDERRAELGIQPKVFSYGK